MKAQSLIFAISYNLSECTGSVLGLHQHQLRSLFIIIHWIPMFVNFVVEVNHEIHGRYICPRRLTDRKKLSLFKSLIGNHILISFCLSMNEKRRSGWRHNICINCQRVPKIRWEKIVLQSNLRCRKNRFYCSLHTNVLCFGRPQSKWNRCIKSTTVYGYIHIKSFCLFTILYNKWKNKYPDNNSIEITKKSESF